MDDDASYTQATPFRRLALGHLALGLVGLVGLLVDSGTAWLVGTVAACYGALLLGGFWFGEVLRDHAE